MKNDQRTRIKKGLSDYITAYYIRGLKKEIGSNKTLPTVEYTPLITDEQVSRVETALAPELNTYNEDQKNGTLNLSNKVVSLGLEQTSRLHQPLMSVLQEHGFIETTPFLYLYVFTRWLSSEFRYYHQKFGS